MTLLPLPGCVYQAAEGFEGHLERELGIFPGVQEASAAWDIPGQPKWNSLYYSEEEQPSVFWTRNIWQKPFRLEFDSINEAASALKAIQRNWAPVLFTQFRRGALIQSRLPPVSQKPKQFPWLLPDSPMGSWTLLDAHTLLGSAECSSPLPAGNIEFAEDKEGPPSRAYLKLQEALVRARKWPVPGDSCLDAGASPGGWSWVLAGLGTELIAVDRSPLDERLMARPNIRFIKHDAFTLKPEDLGPMDWVFSDVICYPPRLYEWVEKWLESGLCENFICTIKMQGEADFETTRRFAAIPGSSVTHLCYNKHELTWIRVGEPRSENSRV